MWGYMGSGSWGYGGAAMGLFMLLLWLIALLAVAAVIWGVVRGVSRSRRGPHNPGPEQPSTALHILEERYARGEIGKEEFNQKKLDLKH